MTNEHKKQKANEMIEKAIDALSFALDLIEKTEEYNATTHILHSATVKRYNDLTTALLIIKG